MECLFANGLPCAGGERTRARFSSLIYSLIGGYCCEQFLKRRVVIQKLSLDKGYAAKQRSPTLRDTSRQQPDIQILQRTSLAQNEHPGGYVPRKVECESRRYAARCPASEGPSSGRRVSGEPFDDAREQAIRLA